MEQNAQISLLPASGGTITAMSGGGGGGESRGGALPFNLNPSEFQKHKSFLEAITDEKDMTPDKLKDDATYNNYKRKILEKLTPHLSNLKKMTEEGKAVIEITISR